VLLRQARDDHPDMTWEPKESFKAVADFYAAGHTDMPPA
jgi:hypothetical protein